jgi:hypothetical protein
MAQHLNKIFERVRDVVQIKLPLLEQALVNAPRDLRPVLVVHKPAEVLTNELVSNAGVPAHRIVPITLRKPQKSIEAATGQPGQVRLRLPAPFETRSEMRGPHNSQSLYMCTQFSETLMLLR